LEGCTVEDLMVPLAEYATVSSGRTLQEAVLALEKAPLCFGTGHKRSRHWQAQSS